MLAAKAAADLGLSGEKPNCSALTGGWSERCREQGSPPHRRATTVICHALGQARARDERKLACLRCIATSYVNARAGERRHHAAARRTGYGTNAEASERASDQPVGLGRGVLRAGHQRRRAAAGSDRVSIQRLCAPTGTTNADKQDPRTYAPAGRLKW